MSNQKIFCENVNTNTLNNENYRKVAFTGTNMQFVYMSINPLDTIHMEIHEHTDQFIKIEQGTGIAIINNIKYDLHDDIGLIIPAGTSHMIINTSDTNKLKLYTIYAPPEHKPNTINITNPNDHHNNNHYKNKYMKYKHKYFLAKKI